MGLFDDIFKDMFSDEAMFYDYMYLSSLEEEKKKQQEMERKRRAALYDYVPPVLPVEDEPAPPAPPAKPQAVTPPVTVSPKPKAKPQEKKEESPWWENLSYEIMELADKYFVDPELYDDADSFFDELELSSGKDLWEERLWYT